MAVFILLKLAVCGIFANTVLAELDGTRCDLHSGTCVTCDLMTDLFCVNTTLDECQVQCFEDPTIGNICNTATGICEPCLISELTCSVVSLQTCSMECEEIDLPVECNADTGVCAPCFFGDDCNDITIDSCNAQCGHQNDLTFNRTYCQCGLGCRACTDDACLGDVITYDPSENCAQQCVQKYYCNKHGSCILCCGGQCPSYAKLFDSNEECIDECSVRKYFCSSSKKCLKCHGTHCPALTYDMKFECQEACIFCSYGDWSHWSRCIAPCDFYSRVRTRPVETGIEYYCSDTKMEEPCGHGPCPINCRLSNWTAWSNCLWCEQGQQMRRRYQTVPPLFGGICPMVKYVETRACHHRACLTLPVTTLYVAWHSISDRCF